MMNFYECERCHTECYLPAILSIAIGERDRKGIEVLYDIKQYTICPGCAKEILDSVGDKDEIQNKTVGASD